jgi:plasmid stabilization system protein ParE
LKPVRFAFTANHELTAAARWYRRRSPQAARRFKNAIRQASSQVQKHPDAWEMWDPPFRRYFLRSFPFALVYTEEEQTILIIAVMHLRREPGYWK